MDTNVNCRTLCSDIELKDDEKQKLEKRIRSNYYVHL